MPVYTSIQEVISMKVLFIGGTGTISSAIVRNLAEEGNWDIWLINRENRNDILPDGVHQIIADINDEKTVADAIRDLTFDAVCEFIGFRVPDVERDYRLYPEWHRYDHLLRRSYRCLSFLIALRPFCRLAVRNVLQPLPCVSASCSLRGREPDLPCSKSCASVFRRRHSSFSPNWTHDKEYSSIQGRISTFPVSISYIAPITARPSSSSFRITRLLSMRSILLFTFRQQAL